VFAHGKPPAGALSLTVLLGLTAAASWGETQDGTASCPPLSSIIADASLRDQLAAGPIQRALTAGDAPAMAPTPRVVEQLQSIASLEPTYGTELLRLIPREGCDLVPLYNSLQAVSELRGVEYFSASRNRRRILYHESFFVADRTSREPLPDPVVATLPPEETLLLYQRDSTFGRNLYEATYRADHGSVALQLTNITTMWLSIVPLVPPGNFRTLVVAFPTDRGLLLYAVAALRSVDVAFVRERGQISLTNRLNALETWLSTRDVDS